MDTEGKRGRVPGQQGPGQRPPGPAEDGAPGPEPGFGTALRERRRAAGFSQSELAHRVHYDKSHLASSRPRGAGIPVARAAPVVSASQTGQSRGLHALTPHALRR
ncbi:hypothetical protein GCM10018790_71040 [Kitasatospora xanthocidica]|nr:hypothetical protein GCM10018790_71040 [Kitasatospora xanthocidica]